MGDFQQVLARQFEQGHKGHHHHRCAGTPVVVVTFVALLELAREHLLEITQAEAFAPIYVRLAYQPS